MADSAEKLIDSAMHARSDAVRGTASAALLVQFAGERGVAAGRCLRGTGIAAEALRDPAAEITGRQEQALARNIVAALGDPPGLGLEAGLRYGLPTYGIFGFAMLSSSTLREAVSVAGSFLELAYALVDIVISDHAGDVQVAFDDAGTHPEIRRFAVERDSAAVMRVLRELFAEAIPLQRIAFSFPAPDDVGQYVATFGTEPSFGAGRNVASIAQQYLDVPLPRASAFAARQCQQQCAELLARRRIRAGIAGRVRDELLRDPRRMPSQDEIAASLHVSVRTLRRQLAGEQTSFRGLVGETRALLAEELLETGQMTVEEIADRLGYSEASSFVHAFKRWKGIPPSRFARVAATQS
jgi:AraC-like DNA-binding protein